MRSVGAPAIVNVATTEAAEQAYETFSDIFFGRRIMGIRSIMISRIFEVGNLHAVLDEGATRRWRDGWDQL